MLNFLAKLRTEPEDNKIHSLNHQMDLAVLQENSWNNYNNGHLKFCASRKDIHVYTDFALEKNKIFLMQLLAWKERDKKGKIISSEICQYTHDHFKSIN